MFTNLRGHKPGEQSSLIQAEEARKIRIPACYYVATSADGLIADWSGSVDWLNPFFDTDYGFHGFVETIDTVVMGRRTYDRLLKTSKTNPYMGKRFIVLSHSKSSGPHADLFWPGPLDDLMVRLDSMGSKSLWVVGGGSAAGAFLEAGLLDEVQQFVMPVVLGSGTPLFGPLRQPVSFRLTASRSFPNGVVHLRYMPLV